MPGFKSYGPNEIRELRPAMNFNRETDPGYFKDSIPYIKDFRRDLNLEPSKERLTVRSGDIEAVKKIVKDRDVINERDLRGWTLLHEASVHDRYVDIAQYLISKGAEVNAWFRGTEGMTPLYVACKYGCKKIAQVLLEAGCDVEVGALWDMESDYMYGPISPLHIACTQDNSDIIPLLLQHGACIDAFDKHKNTPVYYAIHTLNYVAVGILIEAGADMKNTNTDGESPLFYAYLLTDGDKEEMINILLEYCDQSILDVKNTRTGETLLMAMIKKEEQLTLIEKLIGCGADTTISNEKLLALHYAVPLKFDYFKLLIDHTPKEFLEKYASVPGFSLPCYFFEKGTIQHLELLQELGFSDAVLRCMDKNNSDIMSPVCSTILLINLDSRIERSLEFLERLLLHESLLYQEERCRYSKDYPIDKYIMFSEETIDLLEAMYRMHTYSRNHIYCHCEITCHFVMKRIGYSMQISLFNKAARNGFAEGVKFLKYAKLVDAEDVMDAYLDYIMDLEYEWTGHELNVFKAIHEECSKNYSTTILNIVNSLEELREIVNDDRKYNGFLNIYQFLKTDQRTYSLKRMCRHPCRKYIRDQCPDSEPFESFLSNYLSTYFPSSISQYLLSKKDS